MALSFGGDKPKYPQTPGYGDYLDGTSAMPAVSQVVPTSRNPFWGKTIPTYGPPAPYYNLWQGVSEEDRMKPYVISPGDITGQYSLAQPQVTMQRPRSELEQYQDAITTAIKVMRDKVVNPLGAAGMSWLRGWNTIDNQGNIVKVAPSPSEAFMEKWNQAMNPNSAAPEKQPVSQEWLKQMTDKVTKEQEKTKKNQITSYKPKWDSNVPGFRDIGDGRGGYFTDDIYTDAYGNKYVFGDSIHGKGWRLIEKGKLPSLTGANKGYYSYPQYSISGGGGGWGYSYPRYSGSGGGGNDWVKRLLTSWRIGLR